MEWEGLKKSNRTVGVLSCRTDARLPTLQHVAAGTAGGMLT